MIRPSGPQNCSSKPALAAGFAFLGSFFGSALFFDSVFSILQSSADQLFQISIPLKYSLPFKEKRVQLRGQKSVLILVS
jgi:hypothetical protein